MFVRTWKNGKIASNEMKKQTKYTLNSEQCTCLILSKK